MSEGQDIEETIHQGDAQKKWGLGTILFVVVLGVLIVFLAIPTRGVIAFKADQMVATSNCRQIMMAMKAYAADYDGKYPTGKTANEVFRKLIHADIILDERVFGCTLSRYVPDGDMGKAPDFAEAVRPGENHWMVVDGLKDTSPSLTPLVFENALEATWPPFWDGSTYDKIRKRGQTWQKGKIIIGLNDNSVSVEKVGGADIRRQTVQPWADGKSIWDRVPMAKILDIEE